MRNLFVFGIILMVVSSCTKEDNSFESNGMKPIYGTIDTSIIEVLDPRPIIEGISLVLYQDLLLIVDKFKGVHILDNSDPANPSPVLFVSIVGCTQVTVSDDILFSNFGPDLVMMDISDLASIKVVDLILDVYPEIISVLPSSPLGYSGFFECVDPSKGELIGWEPAVLSNPKCQIR